jgi:lipopolysaccharide biosynthesis glycosyltransferase
MKTHIAYVLVSGPEDIYYEQALLSAYSLMYHNKDANIYLVVDKETASTLTGSRSEISQYVKEMVVVDTPSTLNRKETSRYLKTNLRHYLTGDILFIDCDTIICGDLSSVDETTSDIAAVPNEHINLSELRDINQEAYNDISNKVNVLFGRHLVDTDYYFNSGVLYIKDTPQAKRFFDTWHHYWMQSREKGCVLDQPSFYMANRENSLVVERLDDIFNAQICYTYKYFHEARIIHYFSSIAVLNGLPFTHHDFYQNIKKEGQLTKEAKQTAIQCKREIPIPAILITNKKQINFLFSDLGLFLMNEYDKKSIIYRLINSFYRLSKRIKSICRR